MQPPPMRRDEEVGDKGERLLWYDGASPSSSTIIGGSRAKIRQPPPMRKVQEVGDKGAAPMTGW